MPKCTAVYAPSATTAAVKYVMMSINVFFLIYMETPHVKCFRNRGDYTDGLPWIIPHPIKEMK